ncbi:MAG: RNA-binding transcriptional accessory protein [Firmicutes bacterium]|nr:RNA-binding transcriptional accessory protein [Bacillota bacterium]
MNENIIKDICINLNIKESGVVAVLKLLEEGNTIPFIARYRKEATGALDEEQIRKINEVYEYEVGLLKRKEDVIRLIDEKGLMTEELKNKILECKKLVEVEDLYRPYKEKKKTKATDAINNGLEPLAKMIMSFPVSGDMESLTKKFINDKVKDTASAIEGAGYIIAEYISDNAYYRKWIRSYFYKNGQIICKKKKDAEDEKKTYEMYYDYSENVKEIKSHRILAINRAEKEKVLTVNINVNDEEIISFLNSKVIKNPDSFVVEIVENAIKDSYKRLIKPSVEREVRSELSENAEETAIENFAKNLESLLMTPPMKGKMVLGLDPAFRTGCKLAVLNPVGKVELIEKIYPHEPVKKYEEAKKKTIDIINKYNIDIVAIGNGTASRESEKFIIDVIKSIDRKVEYIIVSEAGASVYSASKLAIEEFPNLHVEERSAVSIGRRLQDPLAELVKIDPESIGVGLYQHDVSDKKLSDSLDFVVSKAVNSVGVNINTASPSLLKYISGITKKNIEKIISYREEKGKITSRAQIKKAKLLSDKTFEQAIGFMRVLDGENVFDKTDIHPESYDVASKLLKEIGLTQNDIGTDKMIKNLSSQNAEDLANKLDSDKYTVEDIIKSLQKPNRDPRDEMPKPLLKSDILEIKDLKVGMKLQGTVRNVIDFGAFIDIGLHNDGLVHISKMCDKYIKHPSEVLSVGDIIDCCVIDVNLEKEKVSLSLLAPGE